MLAIEMEEVTEKGFPMAEFWKRKDTVLVCGGSIPCIREAYVLAVERNKLDRLSYVPLTEEEYVLSTAEERIREEIRSVSHRKGVNVIIFYLSCPDILIRMDFQDMEESLSRETGKVVRCFFRGPLGKGEKGYEKAEDFVKHLPPDEGGPLEAPPLLPPPVADCAGISDWLRFRNCANILVTPAGCRSSMVHMDMMTDQKQVYYTKTEEKDYVFGMEETTEKQTAELLKDSNIRRFALIGSAVPSFMGMNGQAAVEAVEKETKRKGLFFKADGFHDILWGVSEAERKWVEESDFTKAGDKKKTVLILGYSPLLCGDIHQYDGCLHFLREEGLTPFFSGQEEVSARPSLVWVVSSAGLLAAEMYEKRYGTPVLISCPVGDHALSMWQKHVRNLVSAGKGRAVLKIHNMDLPHTRKEKVLFIGDPVHTMAAAHALWHEGFSRLVLGAYEWSKEDRALYERAPGTEWVTCFKRDENLKKLGEEADIIVADPLLLPFFPGKHFIPFPWGALSGRRAVKPGSGVMGHVLWEELQNL